MKLPVRNTVLRLTMLLLATAFPFCIQAKSYSSSGGHSYSSSSSHSSSYGGSHSFSSGSHNFSSGGGSTRTSSSGGGSSSHTFSSGGGSTSRSSGPSNAGSSRSFGSGSGKSYSAGSSSDDSNRRGYSSTKSYAAGAEHKFTSTSGNGNGTAPAQAARRAEPGKSDLNFDTGAARARKEEASKADFNRFKQAQNPSAGTPGSYQGSPPPVIGTGNNSYRSRTYVPDSVALSTRPVRIYNVYNGYWSRPWVTYHDPYSSFFWWWLLDRSLDDQAYWAYHHRYDMDPARYEALMANNQQLENRVAQLETQKMPRDPAYTPTGLDGRDLMYSDHYVTQTYSNRPTRSGSAAFWVIGVPAAAGACALFIWLIWFKRWQTST